MGPLLFFHHLCLWLIPIAIASRRRGNLRLGIASALMRLAMTEGRQGDCRGASEGPPVMMGADAGRRGRIGESAAICVMRDGSAVDSRESAGDNARVITVYKTGKIDKYWMREEAI